MRSFFKDGGIPLQPPAGMPYNHGMVKRSLMSRIGVLLAVFWISILGSAQAAQGNNTVFVLVYHSFLGDKPYPSDIARTELRAELNALKQNGFRFVSFTDLVNGKTAGTRNILVTIDDGNQSVYQTYKEVFKPLGIKPLLSIYPNIIGKKDYALTWDQLAELARAGCDIAAHGFYHYPLNQKAYDKDPEAFRKEIFHSKEVLEQRLHVPVQSFVYPNGVRADITKKTLKEAGYRYAFTILWGPVRVPLSQNTDPFELPRYMVYKSNWAMILSAISKAQE